MSSIMDLLAKQLSEGGLNQMSRQIGADENATATAVSSALPVLIGALSKNATREGGAESLMKALQRDHDGSALDDLTNVIRNPEALGGSGILRHVLGDRKGDVEQGLSQASGLDASSIQQLLVMLAPMVMGALGKQQRKEGLDLGGLAGMLAGERRQAKRQMPGAGGLLASFLDQDGDGDVTDDVARMGAGLLGNLFGGKR